MFSVDQSIDLRAPAGRVWRVVSDLNRYREWHPFISLSGTAEVDAEIKMTYRTRFRALPAISSNARIIRLEPQRVIAWKLGFRGLLQVEESFELEKTESGTRLWHRMRFRG